MQNYWQFYDELIEQASPTEKVRDVYIGSAWTFLATDEGNIGTAMTVGEKKEAATSVIGKTLRDTAALVKSWNYRDASVGLAAINAGLNRVEYFPNQENTDAFLRYQDRFIGKKVAVVGHFAYLEQRLEGKCDLYVLERRPTGDDIPDPACEYLLPEMDAVIITGSAVTNKTMPRLLDLSRNAFTVISGPSTPMQASLFRYGADSLCGFCITDKQIFSSADLHNPFIFKHGEMVCMENFQ